MGICDFQEVSMNISNVNIKGKIENIYLGYRLEKKIEIYLSLLFNAQRFLNKAV